MCPFLSLLDTARWADAGLMADPGSLERDSVQKGKSKYSTEHMPVEGPSYSVPCVWGLQSIWLRTYDLVSRKWVQILPLPHTSCVDLGSCGWSLRASSWCLSFLICKLGITGVVASLGELCLSSGATLRVARPEQIHFVERL